MDLAYPAGFAPAGLRARALQRCERVAKVPVDWLRSAVGAGYASSLPCEGRRQQNARRGRSFNGAAAERRLGAFARASAITEKASRRARDSESPQQTTPSPAADR